MYKLASEYVKNSVICLVLLFSLFPTCNWYCTLGSFGGAQCDAGYHIGDALPNKNKKKR